MAATYTDTLPTNKDWVRFLISDTDVSSAFFTDEEITAVLAEETSSGTALKYYAAASCLSTLLARWQSAGKGIREKMVSRLRIRYGAEDSVHETLSARIKELRKEGAERAAPSPKFFFAR